MAITQAQITVANDGTQVVVFSNEAVNSSDVFLQNTGSNTLLLGPQSFLSPPRNLVAVDVVGGGTFAANTYYWQITSTNVLGETIGSAEATITVANNDQATLTWTAATGASGYKIYRSLTSGGETTTPTLVTTIGSGATTTYTDTGSATSSGAAPITNTAAVPALYPLVSNATLAINSVLPSDALVAQVKTTGGSAGQLTLLAFG